MTWMLVPSDTMRPKSKIERPSSGTCGKSEAWTGVQKGRGIRACGPQAEAGTTQPCVQSQRLSGPDLARAESLKQGHGTRVEAGRAEGWSVGAMWIKMWVGCGAKVGTAQPCVRSHRQSGPAPARAESLTNGKVCGGRGDTGVPGVMWVNCGSQAKVGTAQPCVQSQRLSDPALARVRKF